MSSPTLSSLSAETARLDRQAAGRIGRDTDPAAAPTDGTGSFPDHFSGLLDQARQMRTAEAGGDRGRAEPTLPTSSRATASSQSQPVRPADASSAAQRAVQARQIEQRQLDQRRAESRSASAAQADRARPADRSDQADRTERPDGDSATGAEGPQDGDRTDPSAASGATPTWLMHTVVRASLRGVGTPTSAGGEDLAARSGGVGPGSGGTGDVAAAAAWMGGSSVGWAGPRGAAAGSDATGSGAIGSGASATDPAAGGQGQGPGLGPTHDLAAAEGSGRPGALALDPTTFQSVPGQESFAAQLAAQATPVAPASMGAGATGLTAMAATEARIDTPVDAPGFGEAVMQRVVHLARDGAQEIKLHLNPVEMGPIQIRIAIESGQARIEFGAAAEATRQALEQAMPALAQSLQADGLGLAAGSGVAPRADPTLAGADGQPPGGAMAQSGGGQSGDQGRAGSSGVAERRTVEAGSGRTGIPAPAGHELRSGWAGTARPGNGILRGLDLYA